MSRNFDLLAEVERERGAFSKAEQVPIAAKHPAAKVTLPQSGASVEPPELFRLVRSIFLANNGSSPRRVAFFGVDTENGSSAVCAKAAMALARNTSKPVCAVDANIRSAGLSQILGGNRTTSLPGKFSSLRDQCAQLSGNLWLAGVDLMSDGHGSLLPIDELNHRLMQLGAVFEFLVIDAPGTGATQDAEILAHLADGGVLIIEANKTRRTAAAKAIEKLETAGVRILGTVLNDRTYPIPDRLYKFL